ncbi:MAG: hypothetical protein IT478_01570 [Xanthomonadales bacterium]|jgi:hypothetical protein|nr:hypothetical protein [Xanthomonadales bacterium]
MIDRQAIGVLLKEASALTQHREFVIIGSLSVLGSCAVPPQSMVLSIDVDLYPRFDPGRASEIGAALGPSSAFHSQHGFYADAVGPALAALPEDWESRLCRIEFADGIVGLFLDPDDAAVSKLARSEPHDLRWVREGLKAGLLDAAIIERRMGDAPFVDQAEHERARASLRSAVARIARIAGRRR